MGKKEEKTGGATGKEISKKGRPKGAKTVLNFSKLKAEGMNRLFKELDIVGPYGRLFSQEDFTIPQLRKWLKWLIKSDEFSPLKPTLIKPKDEKDLGLNAFYTFNWYSHPNNDKSERYYQSEIDKDPALKKKYNLRTQELKKDNISMVMTNDDDLILNPENKNITKKMLMEKLEKFVEQEKQS